MGLYLCTTDRVKVRHHKEGGGGHMGAVTSGQHYVTLLMDRSEVRLPNPRKRKVPVSQGRRQQRRR